MKPGGGIRTKKFLVKDGQEILVNRELFPQTSLYKIMFVL